MLIKCTECGHDVSDKAERCLNCGCPISEILQVLEKTHIYCSINGKREDITWIKKLIDGLSKEQLYHYKYVWSQDMGTREEKNACFKKYCGTPEDHFYGESAYIPFQIRIKYNLKSKPAVRFLYELIETNFELDEFNGETDEKDIKDVPSNKQTFVSQVRCPYCGSIDVKKIFFGGFAQKQWHCNKCRSDF